MKSGLLAFTSCICAITSPDEIILFHFDSFSWINGVQEFWQKLYEMDYWKVWKWMKRYEIVHKIVHQIVWNLKSQYVWNYDVVQKGMKFDINRTMKIFEKLK